jgi:chemotaxis protein MotB
MALIGKRHTPTGDNHEIWIVSYADMMTLLFGFFVILYSLSQVDDRKLSVVGKQLAAAFRGEIDKKESQSEVGMLMEARQIRALQLLIAMLNLGETMDQAVDNIEHKVAEAKNLDAAREAIKAELKPEDDATLAAMKMSMEQKEDRVEIALPDTMLFEPGTADLTPKAKLGLRRIASSLSKLKGLVGIDVSGHTDSVPPSPGSRYPSNWALSAARAGAVAEELVKNGLDPKGLSPRGMASLQPLFPETREDGTRIPENMAKNRRVQITIKRIHYGDLK